MKIILNSDVLWTKFLIKTSLSSLDNLIHECRRSGHVVIIPQTTLLEFDRQQLEYVEIEINRLKRAYELLDQYKVSHETPEPSSLIAKPDLVELIKKLGAEVIVETPTLGDFEEAHKRACLHMSPGLKKKHDEMRDLVIWMMAIRIATKEKMVLLISNDEVHTGPLGDMEAESVGLVRLKSIDDALAYFGLETPSGLLIKQLIEPIWDDLLRAKLPLEKKPSVIGLTEPIFVQGRHGISKASGLIAIKTVDGKTLKANFDVMVLGDKVDYLMLTEIAIDGAPWKVKELTLRPGRLLMIEKDDFEERFKSLKEVVGG
jgi:hypothetical protein